MNILNANINWNLGWNNSPELQILVDKIPDDLRYEFKEGMFFAEKGGYVSFFAHNGDSKNHGGYGGRVFDIIMKDGTKKTLAGPWSGRSGVVNKMGFVPCVEVAITDNPEDFDRGYTFCAGSVTLDVVEKALCNIPNVRFLKTVKWEGEVYYEFRNSEGDCEVCKGFKHFVDHSGEDKQCRWCGGTGWEKDHKREEVTVNG